MNRLSASIIRLTVWLCLATIGLTLLALVSRADSSSSSLDDLQGVIVPQIAVYDVSVTSPTWTIDIQTVKRDK